ncbi:MAG: PAS domain S-box protein [Candidatus Schekmanbacteria bacterium]|nr:PAS domain S-box protein [Candidatus Schekmanbacteria bacterium]
MSEPTAEAARLREMDLAEQTAFLNSILEGSTEYAIIAKDLDGNILAWNEGARRIYGYDPPDVLGRSALVLHDPADVASGRARDFLEEARSAGKWEGRIRRVRRDGSGFTAQVTMTLRRDPDGTPIGFTMISRDLTESERVESELRESQEYNRGLIESNIDALMTTDPLGVITDVNRQMCEMTGFNRNELLGTPFKLYFTDPRRAEDGIRKVLTEDRVTNYELTMRSRDGRETVVSYNATTFRAEGRLKGVFAAARDITEQKRLEEDLRQAQNYTRGLIEASVDALMTVDPQRRIMDVNEQTIRVTGYSREELIGSPFPDYFTDPDRASAGVEKTLTEGFVTNYVLALRFKSGQETLVSFNASVFRDTDGHLKGIFAAARDITEQKRLEEELRQAQNYTRGLIESSVDPMVTVDPDLTITDVNEQMVRLTEVAKDRLIGSRFDRYFTEPERASSGVRQTLREGYVTNYELTLHTPSGRQVVVSFNASIFKDTAGKVRGIFAVARDVTEQRRLEQQLREQQNYSRGLIEASVDALVTVDPAGRITDVNDQFVRLTGHHRQKLVSSPFADTFTDPDRARAGVRKTFNEGLVKNYELVARSSAGQETIVSFNAAVFRDTAGRVAGIFAAARDVSDQKQLEQKLREQQTYARGLIESNIDALMTTDPLGIITDVNQQMCAVTGLSREELMGAPFKDFCTDPKRAEDGIRKVLAESRVTNYELTIRARDGRVTVVSYNATTFTGEDGKLRGVFAAARDITDQKRLEEQLRQAQAYNRGLIESSVDAMLTVAPDTTITDVNEQMVKLTAYGRAQLIGSSFKDYFTEPENAAEGVRKTLDEGYVTGYELTLRSRHRRLILVSFNASVYKDTAGNVRGVFAVARDVTEQRRLEEKLRESENYNRGLIESSVDALVTVDPDLSITDVNEQFVRLAGYSRDDLVGSPFKDYFTEPDRAAAGVRQTLEEGTVTNYELVLKSLSGKRTVVSFNAGTFKDTAGRVAGILAAARDITAQQKLQEQLRDQQSYNRSLIESSVDALVTVDPNGVITDVNEQTVKLTGMNRRQLVGSPFVDYFTDPQRARAGVSKTFEEGTVTNYELVVKSRSGRKVAVSFNAAVFRETSGEVGGILAAAREITVQKRIEQELRDQQSYTRGLIESNIDALMTTDPLGIITDVNKQMCEVTGTSREELIGTPFKDYVTDPRRAEDGIRQVLGEGRVTNYELTILARDGRETVVSYNATTFTGADGKLRGVFAAARDVTDQKLLESQVSQRTRELIEATAFLNNILESSTEYSIIAKDLEGRILAWNEGARRTYGYAAEEMVGRTNARVLHTPEDVESGRAREALTVALRTGKFEGEFQRVRKNGQRFTAQVAITLRRDATGEPIGYVLISKDITAQKLLEEQLRKKNEELEQQNRRVEQANRMKSEFLANMSHELRTPLNGIIGFAELLYTGKVGPVPENHQEYLGDILSSARHLLRLINDVLDLAKVEAGKIEFRIESVDLERLVGEVRDVLRGIAAKKRIRLETAVDPGVREVVGDPSKLKQILYNYLSNALKFTPDEGHVAVRCLPESGGGAEPEWFRIEVEDNGIGIRPEDMARLFVEFQQLDGSAAKRFQGTGLGLALTRRLVEAQGGRVEARSVLNQGSTFVAILPRQMHAGGEVATSVPVPTAVAAQPGFPTLLVVDDEPADREWLVRTLSKAGYGLVTAATGAEAVRAARKQSFAAVTLDLLLPDISGWKLLEELRSTPLNRDLKAIVVSVLATRDTAGAFAVDDFLVKPVSAEALISALHRSGLSPSARVILVVDDDPAILRLTCAALDQAGYRSVCAADTRAALDSIARERPMAAIIEPLMLGAGLFDLIDGLRALPGGTEVHIIVWTLEELSREEEARIRRVADALLTKADCGVEAVIRELAVHGLRVKGGGASLLNDAPEPDVADGR